jgi:hypothetical protein
MLAGTIRGAGSAGIRPAIAAAPADFPSRIFRIMLPGDLDTPGGNPHRPGTTPDPEDTP